MGCQQSTVKVHNVMSVPSELQEKQEHQDLHILPSVASSEMTDDVQFWHTVSVHPKFRSAKLSCIWNDQGHGNRKAHLFARSAGKRDWVRLTNEPAPHSPAKLEVTIPRSCLRGSCELGYRVGGGGGHSIDIQCGKVKVNTLFSESKGKEEVVDMLLTIPHGDKKYQYLLDQPYGDGTYGEAFKQMRESSNKLVMTLVEEFIRLLDVHDQPAVRKAAAVKFICQTMLDASYTIDLEEIIDHPSYLEETVLNSFRIFGEEKHSIGYNFGTGSMQDQKLVGAILQPGRSKQERKDVLTSLARSGKMPRYEKAFNLFIEQIQKDSGVTAAKPFTGMSYKPIQSLFNKMYVRRGQMAMNLIGDLQRGTLLVDTPEQLDAIKQCIKKQNGENLQRDIEKRGNLAIMLNEISQCTRIPLADADGKVIEVIVYRVKDNSSQKERTDRGELSHVMNINFFIDGPQADCSRNSTIIGACELQVGVMSTLEALRGNHVPYERQRILDGIPQLAHHLNKDPLTKNVNYEKLNQHLSEYHSVRTTSSLTLTHKDGKSHASSGQTYCKNCEPKLYCVNHGRVNAWKKGGYHLMQIWECNVNPSAKYVVEQLCVNIRDQGWGNIGVNIAFFAIIGEYMVEVASRALRVGERRLSTLDLVKDNFNFSRFMFSSYLPPGTHKVCLVAMGRLKDACHEFNYSGHTLKLGVLA